MIFIRALLFFLLAIKLGHADELLTRISARVTKTTITEGEFQQEKHLKFLYKPLLSKGIFTYHQNKGVIWKTQTPIDSTLIISENRLSSGKGEQPVPPAFGRVFKRLLGGELNQLTEDFETAVTEQKTTWQIQLMPKDELMKKVVSTIRLKGDTEIRLWELQETNGNLTRISFTQITHPQKLSSGQLADFENVSP